MRFPRNAKIQRTQFDVAPFAAVFFLLVIFLMLAALIPTQGISLQLPAAGDLPGTDKPVVAVAVDSEGRFYFGNQLVASETELKNSLSRAAADARMPLTLLVHADKSVPYEQLLRLALLAREAGILTAQLATLPRVTGTPLRNE